SWKVLPRFTARGGKMKLKAMLPSHMSSDANSREFLNLDLILVQDLGYRSFQRYKK
ncbi:hypothetical protein MKW92_003576, partial [Papaver armeniacum]